MLARTKPLRGWALSLLVSFGLAAGASAAAPAGLDESFGDGGVSIFDLRPALGIPDNTSASASAPTADGGIVVVGTRGVFSGIEDFGELQLVKLTASGQLDHSFGDGGRIIVPGERVVYGGGLGPTVQPDGKILFGARPYPETRDGFMLARVHPDGTRDRSFGEDGVLKTLLPGFRPVGPALLPDGKMLFSASSTTTTARCFVRLTSDGLLDPTFGTGGVVNVSLPFKNSGMGGPALLPDGKFLVSCVDPLAQSDNDRSILMRFTATGALDTTFGVSGYLRWPSAPGVGFLSSVVLLANGDIMMVDSSGRRFRQYNADGTSFESFEQMVGTSLVRLPNGNVAGLSLDGVYLLDMQTRTSRRLVSPGVAMPGSLRLDHAGGFMVTGYTLFGPSQLSVKRYDSSGELLQGFGNGGVATHPFLTGEPVSVVRLRPLADGSVVTAYGWVRGDRVPGGGWDGVIPGRCLLDPKGMPGPPRPLVARGDGLVELRDLTASGEFFYPEYYGKGFMRLALDGTTSLLRTPGLLAGPFGLLHFEMLSTGQVLANGGVEVARDGIYEAFATIRLLAAGGLQRSLRLPYRGYACRAVRDRAGGWIVELQAQGIGDVSLCHVLPSFVLDRNFGTNGFVKLDPAVKLFGSQPICVLGDGRIAVAVTAKDHAWTELQIRSRKGALLGSAPIGALLPGQIHLVADTNGQLVFAGSTADGFAIHRLAADGTLDPSFGGEVANGFERSDDIWDLTRAATGEWWVGGNSSRISLRYPFVAKFKPEPVTATLVNPDAPVRIDPGNKKTQLHSVIIVNHTDQPAPRRRLRVSNIPLVALVSNGVKVPGTIRVWDVPVPAIPANGSVTVPIRYVIPTRPAIVFQPSLQLIEPR